MIRKNLMKSLSVIMAAMIAMMSVACGANTVENQTAQIETQEEAKIEDTLVASAAAHSSDSEAGKVETVYVKTDANGAVNDVIVSEWLKNVDASTELSDTTQLKDIVNVKGSESFTDNGDGTLTWNASGADIYYQGTTDKKLPVDMHITYTLDGKEISPEELAGKSGKVTIRFDYENKEKQTVEVNGKQVEVYTPFAMVSGMMLDSDKFTNVEISNGKVISDGGNYIVMGVAVPGLKESLDIDDEKWDELNEDGELDEKLADHFEITADTTDFELGMTITMASSDILSDFGLTDLSDSDKINDLKDDMGELNDGSTKLVDGSKELKDGTSDLREGVAKLYDGSKELKDGTQDLKDGTAKLYDGTGSLYDGTNKLYDGTGSLYDGTTKLSDGTGSLYDGVVAYTDGASKINEGAAALATGASSAKSGADQLKTGVEAAKNGSAKLVAGSEQVKVGVTQLVSTIKNLSKTMEKVAEYQEMYNQIHAANAYLQGSGQWTEDTAKGFVIISNGEITSQGQVDKLIEYNGTTRDGVTSLNKGMQELNTKVNSLIPNEAENEQSIETGELSLDEEENAPTVIDEEKESLSSDVDEDNDGTNDNSSVDDEESELNNTPVDEESELNNTPVDEESELNNTSVDENSENDSSSDITTTSLKEQTLETQNYIVVGDDTFTAEDIEAMLGASLMSTSGDGSVTLTKKEYEDYQKNMATLQELLTLKNQIDQLPEGMLEKLPELAQYSDMLDKLPEYKQLIDQLPVLKDSIKQLAEGSAKIEKGMTAVEKYNQLVAAGSATEAVLSKVLSAVNGMGITEDQVKAMDSLVAGATQVADGNASLNSGITDIYNGTVKLDTGLGTLSSGATQLKDGTGQLVENNGKLVDGASQLKDGAGQLKDGAYQLKDGAYQLKDGAYQLNDGAKQLDDGATKLNDGVGELYDGVGELNDGAIKLDDGVQELLDGVIKLDEEGIKKLYEAFDGDLTEFTDRLSAIREAGENYTSFGGASEDVDSSVKFIIKTDAIKSL